MCAERHLYFGLRVLGRIQKTLVGRANMVGANEREELEKPTTVAFPQVEVVVVWIKALETTNIISETCTSCAATIVPMIFQTMNGMTAILGGQKGKRKM